MGTAWCTMYLTDKTKSGCSLITITKDPSHIMILMLVLLTCTFIIYSASVSHP